MCVTLLAITMKAPIVVGRGKKSQLRDPGSEFDYKRERQKKSEDIKWVKI